mmetsp:Transcript_39028/g.83038  ORF Transcript_39028/g.83038 Transcript_39028/m.83038 type:complete len:310 (+) Transcript_39028:892-1821(+)
MLIGIACSMRINLRRPSWIRVRCMTPKTKTRNLSITTMAISKRKYIRPKMGRHMTTIMLKKRKMKMLRSIKLERETHQKRQKLWRLEYRTAMRTHRMQPLQKALKRPKSSRCRSRSRRRSRMRRGTVTKSSRPWWKEQLPTKFKSANCFPTPCNKRRTKGKRRRTLNLRSLSSKSKSKSKTNNITKKTPQTTQRSKTNSIPQKQKPSTPEAKKNSSITIKMKMNMQMKLNTQVKINTKMRMTLWSALSLGPKPRRRTKKSKMKRTRRRERERKRKLCGGSRQKNSTKKNKVKKKKNKSTTLCSRKRRNL